jgi:hypothetical protein
MPKQKMDIGKTRKRMWSNHHKRHKWVIGFHATQDSMRQEEQEMLELENCSPRIIDQEGEGEGER